MRWARNFAALWVTLALGQVATQALAATDDDGYNEVTIRPSDRPANAPRFDDDRVEVYRGSNAAPDLKSHPRSRLFRTRLAEAAKHPVNFAGHFVLASWGCGTNCSQLAIIDVRTGRVFHPQGFRSVDATNIHGDLLPLEYRQDSSLLVLIGSPEERTPDRGIH